ncbi:3-hydroxyacyl-CoA dehydrogenase [Taklimakanibacter deserti]|uniref:3-hydroxyacyl-CoA dehydrogenase n=1 Tax=Taklimakanibacter deserti TaxID=2267839 RepID=UPI000E64DFEB
MTAGSAAIVGTGLIGRSWALVFARAGWSVKLFDPSPEAADNAAKWIDAALADDVPDADRRSAVRRRIGISPTLADAVAGATHVQENTTEALELKRTVLADIDRLAAPETIIASSTSALLPSAFSESLPGRARVLVAHPVNPPHLVPLVEMLGAPWTSAEAIARATDTMTAIGQSPIRIHREIDGFVLNRLQAALVNEAMALVDAKVASPADIDKCLTDGLALRWAFIGPFETMDLNADGGFADYARKYRSLFEIMGRTLGSSRPWSEAAMSVVSDDRRQRLPLDAIAERQRWRDSQVRSLRKLKT